VYVTGTGAKITDTLKTPTYAAGNFAVILLVMVGLIIFKSLVVALLSRLFGFEYGVAVRSGVTLAQAGEFSFVVFSLGLENGLISNGNLQVVLAASLLSMFIAPFIIQHNLKKTYDDASL
jgi:CPA2 family monovalent cation:H+ antiporter-2